VGLRTYQHPCIGTRFSDSVESKFHLMQRYFKSKHVFLSEAVWRREIILLGYDRMLYVSSTEIRILCFVSRASCVSLWMINQLDTLNFSNIFICLPHSTCFGHYVSIIRRDPIALTQLLHLSFCEKSLIPIKMLYKLNSDITIFICCIYTFKSAKLIQCTDDSIEKHGQS
jgi:hypothetical protein